MNFFLWLPPQDSTHINTHIYCTVHRHTQKFSPFSLSLSLSSSTTGGKLKPATDWKAFVPHFQIQHTVQTNESKMTDGTKRAQSSSPPWGQSDMKTGVYCTQFMSLWSWQSWQQVLVQSFAYFAVSSPIKKQLLIWENRPSKNHRMGGRCLRVCVYSVCAFSLCTYYLIYLCLF